MYIPRQAASTAIAILLLLFIGFSESPSQCFSCSEAPPGTIWCDDFEDGIPLGQKYFEYDNNGGDCIVMPLLGRDSSNGVRIVWQAGEVGAGGFKKSFGRTPSAYIGKYAVYPDSNFNEIFWRMDVKSQEGWTGGGPAKLSRALTLANGNWATGMMAHLWSGEKDNLCLGMDPASGISTAGELVTTKYNDFDNMRWLGWKAGTTDIYSTTNSGRWYCIEGHVRLNTPGNSDGVFEFWIDDTLQAGSYNLNWHGAWNSNPDNYKINAVFFENYWNSGSPVQQERYFDNIVISTARIGCKCKTTGAAEEVQETTAALPYPVPSDDIVILEVPAESGRYTVVNLLGISQDCPASTAGDRLVFEVRALPRGTYYILSDEGRRYRFVK